jgi:hypothetical protein
LIREIGRTPVERSTLYRSLRRFDDPALDPADAEDKAFRASEEASRLSVAL